MNKHLMFDVESELMMTQPMNPPSLTPESSNVAVVENLTKIRPITYYRVPHGVRPANKRRQCWTGLEMASVPSSNFQYNNGVDGKTKHPH